MRTQYEPREQNWGHYEPDHADRPRVRMDEFSALRRVRNVLERQNTLAERRGRSVDVYCQIMDVRDLLSECLKSRETQSKGNETMSSKYAHW